MAPKTKISQKNKKSANSRWHKWKSSEEDEVSDDGDNFHELPRKINPDIAVMSTFIQGTNYERARIGAATEGIEFPSRATYYRHQKKLNPKIKGKCIDHMDQQAENIYSQRKFAISCDGTYPKTRDSIQCAFSCMDCVSNKVLKANTLSKDEVNVSSNMLESKAARICFNEMSIQYGHDCCESFTSDNDNKTFNQFKSAGLEAKRRFDPRHEMKCMSRGFYKMTNSFEKEEKEPDIFDEHRSFIISWAVHLVNTIDDSVLRGLIWKNTPEHMIGNHENCMHDELPPDQVDWEVGKRNPELFKMMVNFFNRTEKFIVACEFKNATQCNESLNNLISMLAPKRLHFANSYNVRVLIACGIYNEIHFYSNLLKELNLDRFIPEESMHKIIEYEEQREGRNAVKRTPEYREKKKKQRKKLYAQNDTQEVGDYNEQKKDFTFE